MVTITYCPDLHAIHLATAHQAITTCAIPQQRRLDPSFLRLLERAGWSAVERQAVAHAWPAAYAALTQHQEG